LIVGVVIGEIFQLPIRSKAVALSTASNWFWNAIIGIITPFLVDRDKGDLGVKVFFIWGSTCAICAVFAWYFVPETRGLTLEQVDKVGWLAPLPQDNDDDDDDDEEQQQQQQQEKGAFETDLCIRR
jgi:hypothetical protein